MKSMSEDQMKEAGKIYELAYIFVPTIPEENIPAEAGNLKEMLAHLGAIAIGEDFPKLIPLAYEMEKTISNKKQKFDSGYFGWFKFELEPENAIKLDEDLRRKENIIRFMIIKTVRENTMPRKMPIFRDSRARTAPQKKAGEIVSEEAVPINKEEVDKKIEEMVAAA